MMRISVKLVALSILALAGTTPAMGQEKDPAAAKPLAARAEADGQADETIFGRWYGGLHFGTTLYLSDIDNDFNSGARLSIEPDAGYNFGAILGYKFFPGVRLEGEVTYRTNAFDPFNLDVGSIDILSGMANAWFEPQISNTWIPYVGGGFGASSVTYDQVFLTSLIVVDDADTVLSWQVGTGIGYALTNNIILSLDYRYFRTFPATFTDNLFGLDFDTVLESHNIMIGLRGYFGTIDRVAPP
jgi:opacity protein-like surface antigen